MRPAVRRRIVLMLLVAAQTSIASWSLARTFPSPELAFLELTIITLFAILFSWLSFSFWTSVAGFFLLWQNPQVKWDLPELPDDAPLTTRTAVLMPIYEDRADDETARRRLHPRHHRPVSQPLS
jgi:membrane glycosyltransferase